MNDSLQQALFTSSDLKQNTCLFFFFIIKVVNVLKNNIQTY